MRRLLRLELRIPRLARPHLSVRPPLHPLHQGNQFLNRRRRNRLPLLRRQHRGLQLLRPAQDRRLLPDNPRTRLIRPRRRSSAQRQLRPARLRRHQGSLRVVQQWRHRVLVGFRDRRARSQQANDLRFDRANPCRAALERRKACARRQLPDRLGRAVPRAPVRLRHDSHNALDRAGPVKAPEDAREGRGPVDRAQEDLAGQLEFQKPNRASRSTLANRPQTAGARRLKSASRKASADFIPCALDQDSAQAEGHLRPSRSLRFSANHAS